MTPQLFALVCIVSSHYGLDPYRVAAVVEVESAWNASATGRLGEQGLLQLRPEFYSRPGYDLKNPVDNLLLGVPELAIHKKRCAHKKNGTWVVCHNRGRTGAAKLSDASRDGYVKKVEKAYAKIKAAAAPTSPNKLQCAGRALASTNPN